MTRWSMTQWYDGTRIYDSTVMKDQVWGNANKKAWRLVQEKKIDEGILFLFDSF